MKKLLFILLIPISFYAQNDSITFSKPKLSVIGLDKMNVVYRGIPNPISIAVNDAKSYTITGDGVIFQDGKYTLKPGPGKETKVFVVIVKLDGTLVKEEHIFRIKGLPKPIGTLNDNFSTTGFLNLEKTELKDAVVGVRMIDFLFDIDIYVTEFNLSIKDKKTIVIEGNRFNDEVLKLINSAKKDDYFIISRLRTNYMSSPEVCYSYPAPLVFKVVK